MNIKSQRGASLTEVALLVALIAVIAIPSLQYAADTIACKNLQAGIGIENAQGHGNPQLNLEKQRLEQKHNCSFKSTD